MKHMKLTILAALLAGLSVGGVYAADQTAKQTKDETKAAPSKESMDPAGASSDSSASASSGKTAADVRDWSKIDKNNDHLIQPEEMENWLKQTGPQAAKPKQ